MTRTSLAALILLATLCSSAFAMTGILQIQSPPETVNYYMPGDEVTMTLSLFDENGDQLLYTESATNGLISVEFFLSGPRQDFRVIDPYYEFMIFEDDGAVPGSNFDINTGELTINIPNDLDGNGSYTALFACERIAGDQQYDLIVKGDFPVGQMRPTTTQSLRYENCASCHNSGPHRHGFTGMENCVVCHADGAQPVLVETIHDSHHNMHNCSSCHTASGGIGHYSAMACFTCHNMPGGHSGYNDNQCANCHQGGNSVYSRHGQSQPSRPSTFDLTSPSEGIVLQATDVTLEWSEATDSDNGDNVIYEVELGLDDNFENVVVYYPGSELSVDITGLEPETEYFWRVLALDVNSDGRYSSQTWNFTTTEDYVGDGPTPHPGEFQISATWPNPFNSAVNIRIATHQQDNLEAVIYNTLGQKISTLHSGKIEAGFYNFHWNASRNPAGVYFLQVKNAAGLSQIQKLIYMK